MGSGKRWIVQDRDANPIYLTEERWQHIVDSENHPEMVNFEDHLKTTLMQGRRSQEPLNPRKYRYVYPFADLPEVWSFPLSGLAHLEPEWREAVIKIITSPPVSQVLRVFAFSPSILEAIPVASVEKPPISLVV